MAEETTGPRIWQPGGFVTGRNAALDYLRSFAVLLVLLHHAVLAYVTFGYLNPADPMATFSPVVDGAKWAGFDRIALVNDTFFMPLLFLVSGLFVWASLRRRGAIPFLLGRLKRLGIPFVVVLVTLIPLAYFPTVLEIKLVYGTGPGLGQFWLDFFRAGMDQPGPLWFVWLLFAFDLFVALVYAVFSRIRSRLDRLAKPLLEKGVVFALALFGLSVAAYIPMSDAFGPSRWMGIGPFQVQISRVFVYLLYFLAGVAIGARGLERSVVRRDGPFARYWWAWLALGAGSYAGLTWIFTSAPQSPFVRYVFLAEMALVVLALTAVFLRFARRHVRALDSLSANSYGIYLLHYFVIIWLQYAVLRTGLSAGAKAMIVFFGGLALCWGSIAALRQIPAVRKII